MAGPRLLPNRWTVLDNLPALRCPALFLLGLVVPVTVGANLGTTFTVVFAAFAVVGQDAKIGLQAAFVHLLYNLFAIIVIYVIPVLRPVPLFCAQTFARIAAERKWVIAVWLLTVFIALPALVIILAGVL